MWSKISPGRLGKPTLAAAGVSACSSGWSSSWGVSWPPMPSGTGADAGVDAIFRAQNQGVSRAKEKKG